MKISIADICSATGGQVISGRDQHKVTGVVIDSRQVKPGDLFVAFAGEHTDGHNFLAACAEGGAVAALVERDVNGPEGLVLIRVESTLHGLQDLARWYRSLFPRVQVVGITGSSGKTTTKELTAAALKGKSGILKSAGNQNNEIGLPLTMFSLTEQTVAAVLEMGMGQLGEIARLCEIASPDIGVITNIGEAHIQHLGSKEGILQAKYELAEGLHEGGTLVYNGDDPLLRVRVAAEKRNLNIISCGLNPDNDFRAADVVTTPEGSTFTIHWRRFEQKISLAVPGRHNVGNALLAFAAALSLGASQEEAARGLETARGEKGRMDVLHEAGLTLIDDTYNANPSSVKAALDYLASWPGTRRVAFLGDMLELGELAPQKHKEAGALAAALKLELLVAVGGFSQHMIKGALDAGMSADKLFAFPDSQSAAQAVSKLLPGDVILFKGSRGARMELIIDFIKDGGNN